MESIFWALLGLGLLSSQFLTGLFDFLPPALAAFAVALISLIPGVGQLLWLQALLWAAVSVSSVIWLRMRYPQLFNGRIMRPNTLEHAGKEAVVLEDIAPGRPGRIMFQGTSWSANSIDESIPAGSSVVILEQDSLTFMVSAKPLLEDDRASGNEIGGS